MQSCRRFLLPFFIVFLCFGLFDQNDIIGAKPAGGKNGKKIVFQWAFCALSKADADQKPGVIRRDTTLKSGHQIKFVDWGFHEA